MPISSPRRLSWFSLISLTLLTLIALFTTPPAYAKKFSRTAAHWFAPTEDEPKTDCGAGSEIPTAECTALVQLYQNTDGAHWTHQAGWLNDNQPCAWYGVTCEGGHVTRLMLQNNQLQGELPATLGNLIGLTHLSLSQNALSGALPATLGTLSNLTYLGLWSNQFSGALPDTLNKLSRLAIFDASDNQLNGAMAPTVGDLTALTDLWLRNNRLEGNVPADLNKLGKLQRLSLARNQLRGVYPTLSKLAQANAINDAEYNALVKADSQTQTVPPTKLEASGQSENSISVQWTPITYTADGGYYEISYATAQDGPYTVAGVTTNKSSKNYLVKNLNTDTTYFLRVRTYTPAHPPQQNALYSDYSAPVNSRTLAPGSPSPITTQSDIIIKALEVTQGIQNLANTMPLVQDRVTWVRAYVQSIGENVTGVQARLRGFRDNTELPDSPLLAENNPIIVRTDGGQRTNLNDSFQFFIPKTWRSGTIRFQLEVNFDGAADESSLVNDTFSTTVTFYPSNELSLVMLPLQLYDQGDQSKASLVYNTNNPNFLKILNLAMRYLPISRINWTTSNVTLTPNCGTEATPRACNLNDSNDWSKALKAVETTRETQENVKLWFQSNTQNHWVGMVHPALTTSGMAGLGAMPLKKNWRQLTAYNVLVQMNDGGLLGWPWYVEGSSSLAHELGHNFGLKHINCVGTEANPTTLFPTSYPNCSLETVDPSGFYGFDVYYDVAGLATPTVISNDPNAPAPNAAFPMMGYKFPDWMPSFKYCELLIKFGIPCTLYDYSAYDNPQVEAAHTSKPPSRPLPALVTPQKASTTPPPTNFSYTLPQYVIVTGQITITNHTTPTGDILSIRATEPVSIPVLETEPTLDQISLYVNATYCDMAGRAYPLTMAHLLPDQPSNAAVYEFTVAIPYQQDFADCYGFFGLQTALYYQSPIATTPVQLPLTSYPTNIAPVTSTFPPTLTITTPTTEITLTTGMSLTWLASDADCTIPMLRQDCMTSALSFAISYSPDGEHWYLLAQNLPGHLITATNTVTGAFTLGALNQLPGSQHGRLRVTADDGFFQTSVETGAKMQFPNQPPQPVVIQTTNVVTQGQLLLLQALAHDPEDGMLNDKQFRWRSDRDGLLGTGAELTLHNLTPGVHQITLIATDSQGITSTTTFTVTVMAMRNTPNYAPTAAPDTATTVVGATVGIPVLANDADADQDDLTIGITTAAQHGEIMTNGTVIYYTPQPGYQGMDTFTYTVSDGHSGTATSTVNVAVNVPETQNHAPVATPMTISTPADTPLTILLDTLLTYNSDQDNDPLTINAVSLTSAKGGAVALNGNKITYTPPANFTGADSFTYTVNDNRGGAAFGSVLVTVTASQANRALYLPIIRR
ncbi:MAG: Ig-like domain-containing protein [Caldilineaceae bacterium]